MSIIKIALTTATFALVASGSFAGQPVEKNGGIVIIEIDSRNCPHLPRQREYGGAFLMPVTLEQNNSSFGMPPFFTRPTHHAPTVFPSWYALRDSDDVRPSCGSRLIDVSAGPDRP